MPDEPGPGRFSWDEVERQLAGLGLTADQAEGIADYLRAASIFLAEKPGVASRQGRAEHSSMLRAKPQWRHLRREVAGEVERQTGRLRFDLVTAIRRSALPGPERRIGHLLAALACAALSQLLVLLVILFVLWGERPW